MYEYRAEVMRVVDGDTILMNVDQGFGDHTQRTIRLARVNCPEMTTQMGPVAKGFTERWLKDFNDQVIIRTRKRTVDDLEFADNWRRYVAEVLPPDVDKHPDLKSLNTELLESGNAVPYRG